MTTRALLVSLVVGLLAAVLLLAFATVLDVPALRYLALGAILAVLAAREWWAWRGDGRTWLAVYGGLLGVILLAFVVERLS